MAISDAQKRAANKYIREKTDEIKVRVEKGKKVKIQEHVALHYPKNESVNSFINAAIDEKIERDEEKAGE